jgi:hypothetical protein
MTASVTDHREGGLTRAVRGLLELVDPPGGLRLGESLLEGLSGLLAEGLEVGGLGSGHGLIGGHPVLGILGPVGFRRPPRILRIVTTHIDVIPKSADAQTRFQWQPASGELYPKGVGSPLCLGVDSRGARQSSASEERRKPDPPDAG